MFVAKPDKSTPLNVAEFVVKHGSHDQSSHNPKKGGGRGAGGGASTSGQSHMGEAIADAQEDIANRIKGAQEQLSRSRQSGTRLSGAGQERIKGTIDGYKEAGSLIGKPKELSKLKSDMVRAKKDVMSPSYNLADAGYVNGYADAVISVQSAYGTLEND